MNYQKIYDRLMEKNRHILTRKQGKEIYGYVERHHIIPECIGGPDTDENQVYLSGRQHFLAHMLMVKIDPANRNYWLAIKLMTEGIHKRHYNFTGRMFEYVKRKNTEAQRGRSLSDSQRKKLSESAKRQVHTPERRLKTSRSHKGQKRTPEQCARIAASQTGKTMSEESKMKNSLCRLGKPFSDEHRKNLSLSRIGKKHSEETKARMKEVKRLKRLKRQKNVGSL